MVRIGLMSDTHSFLDEKVLHYFSSCDEIWHAGDIGKMALVRELEAFKPLRAVYGNIDKPEMRQLFPATLDFTIEDVRIVMTHIGGYPGRYDRSIKAKLMSNPPDLFISGHSHILKVMRDKQLNLLHINPGACGVHGWQTDNTLVRFSIDKGKIKDVEVIELGPKFGRKTIV